MKGLNGGGEDSWRIIKLKKEETFDHQKATCKL